MIKNPRAQRRHGAKLWEYLTAGAISASPALAADGTVYVGSSDGYFYAINGTTGALHWRYNVGSEIYSSAAVRTDGTIVFGASDGYLYALTANGALQWRLLTGDYIDSSPVIAADGVIYVGSTDKRLYAVYGNGAPIASTSSWPMFRFNPSHQGKTISATPRRLPLQLNSPPKPSRPAAVSLYQSPRAVLNRLAINGEKMGRPLREQLSPA